LNTTTPEFSTILPIHIYKNQNTLRGMDLPYLKTISQVLNPLFRCWIHSRNQKFG